MQLNGCFSCLFVVLSSLLIKLKTTLESLKWWANHVVIKTKTNSLILRLSRERMNDISIVYIFYPRKVSSAKLKE